MEGGNEGEVHIPKASARHAWINVPPSLYNWVHIWSGIAFLVPFISVRARLSRIALALVTSIASMSVKVILLQHENHPVVQTDTF